VPISGVFENFPSDPSTRRAVSSATVPLLSFQNNFAKDFPNTPDDDFALMATTRAIVVAAGNYRFCTTSDDGSWLYIDGSLVIDNGGLHGASTVCQYKQLPQGIITIAVNFFEHSGEAVLDVSLDESSIKFQGNALGGQHGVCARDGVCARKNLSIEFVTLHTLDMDRTS
jgi:hypothetical protein